MHNFDVTIQRAGADLAPMVVADIWQLLLDADQSFVPPLSSRHSSTQDGFHAAKTDTVLGPQPYFAALQKQHSILALPAGEQKTVAGFMSFQTGYTLPIQGRSRLYHYATTVIVRPELRGQGITSRMYRTLMAEAKQTGSGIATRTWSTNSAHIGLLTRLGFKVAHTVPHDRGEGVDTVYFVKDSYDDVP